MSSDLIRMILMRSICGGFGCGDCYKYFNTESCPLDDIRENVSTEEEFNLAKHLMEQVNEIDRDNTHEWTEEEVMSLFGIG